MTSEFLLALGKANLVAAPAILAVVLLRKPVRTMFGARLAYLIWMVVPAAALAALIPARTLVLAVAAPAAAGSAIAESPVSTIPHAVVSAPVAWDPWLVLACIWFAGAVAMAAWLLRNQLAFLADERRGTAGPAVVGVLRPRIVTPANFADVFDARERAVILEHERVHIARHDACANSLIALAQCVCWFNPLLHIGAHLMRIDQEMACDAHVIARHPNVRRTYAAAMVKAALAGRALPLGCYWPRGTDHPLTERVAMLKCSPPGPIRSLVGTAALLVLAASAGLGAWASQPDRIEYHQTPPSSPEQELASQSAEERRAAEIASAVAALQAAEKVRREIQDREAPALSPQSRPAPQPQAPEPAP